MPGTEELRDGQISTYSSVKGRHTLVRGHHPCDDRDPTGRSHNPRGQQHLLRRVNGRTKLCEITASGESGCGRRSFGCVGRMTGPSRTGTRSRGIGEPVCGGTRNESTRGLWSWRSGSSSTNSPTRTGTLLPGAFVTGSCSSEDHSSSPRPGPPKSREKGRTEEDKVTYGTPLRPHLHRNLNNS